MIYSDNFNDYLKVLQDYLNQLNEDLTDLKSIVANPKIYLLEYFAQFKNNIDIEAQNLAIEHKKEPESVRQAIFDDQSAIINQVEDFEVETFKNLSATPVSENLLNKANKCITIIDTNLLRIKNDFKRTTDFNNDLDHLIDKTELMLHKIALEINSAILSNRTLIFIENIRFKKKFDAKSLNLGKLIVIKDEYISKQSIDNIIFENYEEMSKNTQSPENLKCMVLESRLRAESLSCNSCVVRINLSLNEVTHAKLNNLNLESLDVDAFKAFRNLSSINLSFNRLRKIDKSVLTGLESKLVEIDISRNNHLKSLISFSDFKSLTTLNLSFIQISVVTKDTFRGLDNLMVLYLSHNYSLTKLELSVFDGLLKLVELDLSFNELTDIDVNLFKDLKSLKSLSLEANDLRTLNENTLKNLTKLEVLKLSSNLFKSLPSTLLSGLFNLNSIDISNNSIKSLDQKFFQDSRNLSKILLTDNKLTRIDAIFNNLPNLRVIDLAFNHLKNIDTQAFKELFKLKTIKLNDNKLRHLSLEVFNGICELNELTLSNNQFKELDSNTFKEMKELKLLNLFGNPLDPEIYENATSYFSLDDSVQVNWEQIHTN